MCQSSNWHTDGYLRQSGGKEELFVPRYINEQDSWEPMQKHLMSHRSLQLPIENINNILKNDYTCAYILN